MREEAIPLHHIVLAERLHRVTINEDALHELALSIQAHGLINPVTVTETNGTYTLEAGHRRYLAHKRLQRTHIAARIYAPGEAPNPDALRFAENLHRADLSPMEEAKAINDYIAATQASTDQVAAMLHRSLDWVVQRIHLLTLPDELTVELHTRRLPIAHALALARVGDAEHRRYLLRYALDAGATIHTLRSWVSAWELARDSGDPGTAPLPAMPEPGQAVIITMPCIVCSTPHAYQQLRIVRVCAECYPHIAGAGAPANQQIAPDEAIHPNLHAR